MNGVIVIDKPAGPTSHDVVARMRRALGIARIGHTGTLDPLATGVLPLVVGRATRLAQFFSASDKEYVADIRLGYVSDTCDAEGPITPGAVVARPSASGVELSCAPDSASLDAVLAEFRGTYWQVPPAYSAKKVGGTPAYKLARRHKPAELKPVRVTVHTLEALSADGDLLRVHLVCSTGFYVRALARDIGERLGCGAYLAALQRTRAGSFTIADAVPLRAIEAEGFDGTAHLIAMDRLVPDLPGVVLAEAGVRRVSHGNAVTPEYLADPHAVPAILPEEGSPAPRVRLLDRTGALLGIAEWRAGALLHPVIVLV